MNIQEELNIALEETNRHIADTEALLISINEPENITSVAISLSKTLVIRDTVLMIQKMVIANEQTELPNNKTN